MFCENCGSRINDSDKFCFKCGNRVELNSYQNNDVLLFEVRPNFKIWCILIPKIIQFIFFIILISPALLFALATVERGVALELPQSILLLSLPLILIVYDIVTILVTKKKCQNIVYEFYNDKVIFKNSFLNIIEQEIKYINIKELSKRTNFIQRKNNVGKIILYDNNGSGYINGISMDYIENVDDVYNKIRKIINR